MAFYNGVKIPGSVDDAGDTWDDCAYRIFIDPGDNLDRMDVPKEFLSIDVYCATLGHKVNHSFHPNCDFGTFIHPRFGRIPCIVALVGLSEGDELFCYYHYALNECPKWYSDLWEQQS